MKPSRQVFADNLRGFRKSQGLTQAELSRRSGIAPTALCRLEKATIEPSTVTIDRLAEALSVAPAMLLTPIEEPAKVSA